jgi:hypothetical protein
MANVNLTPEQLNTAYGEALMAGLYPGWRQEIASPSHRQWAECLPNELHWLGHSKHYIDVATYLEMVYANKASSINEAARKLAIVREHSVLLRQQLELTKSIEDALLFNITHDTKQ